MAEYHDPPLRLAIEGLRWMGVDWQSAGDKAAALDVYGTDTDEDAVAVLRALRRIAARRLDMALMALAAERDSLDFDAPNAPTENDLASMVDYAEKALAALMALKQLAPEVIGEDEDDDAT